MAKENPLTLEEKLSITRLIGHDILRQQGSVLLPGQDNETPYSRQSHVRYILMAISQLTKENCCCYSSNVDDNFKTMQKVFGADKRNLAIKLKTKEKKVTGNKHVLYAAIYNLAKNGFNAMKNEGIVTITVSETTGGIIQNHVFIPEGAKQSGYFIKYDVHDTGKGFPTDRPIKEFLQFGVTTRRMGTGFGLHFAKLASKYLQAPLSITSEPGNTHIILYHPVNLPKDLENVM